MTYNQFEFVLAVFFILMRFQFQLLLKDEQIGHFEKVARNVFQVTLYKWTDCHSLKNFTGAMI